MTDQMRQLVKRVAEHYSVPFDRLVATREQRQRRYRAPRVVEARHVSMWLIRHTLRASYPEIARFFHVDHTSVMHACKKIEGGSATAAESLIDRFLFGSTARVGHA